MSQRQSVDTRAVEEFYDDFSSSQQATGINIRHRSIHRMAKKQGLTSSSKVLEVGCGIGTYTSLLAKSVTGGKVVATDISGRSIEMAKKAFAGKPQVEFIRTDMSDFSVEHKFDFFILPDVLEHIPVDQHSNLFRTFARLSHDQSKVIIHIPFFRMLEYIIKNQPQGLQVIDQPLSLQDLCNNAYPHGWYVEQVMSYGLTHVEPDYQFIIMKRYTPQSSAQSQGKLGLGLRNFFSKIFW